MKEIPSQGERIRVAAGQGGSRERPGRLIMITPLDCEKLWNNFEHHRLAYYKRMGYEVALVYKVMNQTPGIWRAIRDVCSLRVADRSVNGAQIVAVDPLFNTFAGYRASAEARAAVSGRGATLELRAARLLSPLAVLRDLFAPACLALAALVKLKGSWDVCVGFGPWGGLAGWVLRKLGKVRLLVYQDRDFEAGLVPDWLRRSYTAAIETFAIRRADLVISVGNLLADLRRSQTGRKVHVVPSGVEWAKYDAARSARRESQGLIYVGNVISWSGLEQAIQAVPRIVRICPGARLSIVGDGLPDYRLQLEKMARDLGIADRVEFLGPRAPSELPALLARARIGLANSEPVAYRRYACPLKVMEYMAAGLPIVATQDTEAGDLLTRLSCGLAVPYEAGALSEAAVRLLTDDALWGRMRENALRHGVEMDWERLLSYEAELIRSTQQELSSGGRDVRA